MDCHNSGSRFPSARHPRLGRNALRERMGTIHIVIPILVTSAPLWVLQGAVPLDKFMAARELEEVATQVECLTVYREAGPELRGYADLVAHRLLRQNGRWAERLDAVRAFVAENNGYSFHASSRSDLGTRLALWPDVRACTSRQRSPMCASRETRQRRTAHSE